MEDLKARWEPARCPGSEAASETKNNGAEAEVLRVLPGGAVSPPSHSSTPSRGEARPADGPPTTRCLGVWPTQACLSLPAGQSQRDKGAANTCRSWPGCRFSLPKRLQLPTVTGIKLRGPDGSLRLQGPKMEGGGAGRDWARGGGGGGVGGHAGDSRGREVGVERGGGRGMQSTGWGCGGTRGV